MSHTNLVEKSLVSLKEKTPKANSPKTEPKTKAKKAPSEQLEVKLDFARASHQASDHVLFSPMHYEPGYAYPLLIWLHGPGNDERQILKMMPLISMRNFVGIAPRGICRPAECSKETLVSSLSSLKNRQLKLAQTAVPELVLRLDEEKEKEKIREKAKQGFFDWPQTDEGITLAEQKVFDCISFAEEKCNVANNRVFLVGFDSGGTMAFRLAMQYPQYFAGAVSLGGRFPEGNLPLSQWNTVRNMPTMLAIGKKSPVYSPEDARGDLRLLHTAGLSVSVRQYDCGQEISTEMLLDVNRWIMERVCDKGNLFD